MIYAGRHQVPGRGCPPCSAFAVVYVKSLISGFSLCMQAEGTRKTPRSDGQGATNPLLSGTARPRLTASRRRRRIEFAVAFGLPLNETVIPSTVRNCIKTTAALQSSLGEQLLDDDPVHVGQPIAPSLVFVGQPQVVDA